MCASASYELSILTRVIQPDEGDMAPELARYVLGLDFAAADHERTAELSARAQEGALSPEETAELDGYLHVNDLLSILQSKARQSLQALCSRRSAAMERALKEQVHAQAGHACE